MRVKLNWECACATGVHTIAMHWVIGLTSKVNIQTQMANIFRQFIAFIVSFYLFSSRQRQQRESLGHIAILYELTQGTSALTAFANDWKTRCQIDRYWIAVDWITLIVAANKRLTLGFAAFERDLVEFGRITRVSIAIDRPWIEYNRKADSFWLIHLCFTISNWSVCPSHHCPNE